MHAKPIDLHKLLKVRSAQVQLPATPSTACHWIWQYPKPPLENGPGGAYGPTLSDVPLFICFIGLGKQAAP